MNKQEIEIAIAESMEWKGITVNPNDGLSYGYEPEPNILKKRIPSYTSDLNAMHEAFESKFKSAESQERFARTLATIYWNDGDKQIDSIDSLHVIQAVLLATCEQWAETYLLLNCNRKGQV